MTAAPLARASILPFVTGGDARWTVRSPSGARYTFWTEPLCTPVRENGHLDGPVDKWVPIPHTFKVLLLTGSENSSRRSYTYIGSFRTPAAMGTPGFRLLTPRPGKKAPVTADAPSAKAAAFLLDTLARKADGSLLPPSLEIWHEGRCCRCGRALTDPESIASGIGPVCASKGDA